MFFRLALLVSLFFGGLFLCAAQPPVLLHETFQQESPFWPDRQAGLVQFNRYQGSYRIVNLSGQSQIAAQAVGLDTAAHFSFTATFQQVRGRKRSHYGLVWAMADFERYHAFLVSPSGYFTVYNPLTPPKKGEKQWELLPDKTLVQRTATVTLGMARQGKEWVFSLNGTPIHRQPVQPFFGSQLGFLASEGVVLQVEEAIIQQASPPPSPLGNGWVQGTAAPVHGQAMAGTLATHPVAQASQLWYTQQVRRPELGTLGRATLMLAPNTGEGPWNQGNPILAKPPKDVDQYFHGVLPNGQLLLSETWHEPASFEQRLALAKPLPEGGLALTELTIEDLYSRRPETGFQLSSDGQHLLLLLERAEGMGGLDVYHSALQPNGTWSLPKPLGPAVNTAADELSVYLGPDDRTLIVATQGRPGYGQTDFFVSFRQGEGWQQWSEPQNMGPAINTPGAERDFFFDPTSQKAFYSSNAQGPVRLYSLPCRLPTPDDVLQIQPETPQTAPQEVVAMQTLSGQVLNALSNQPIAATLVFTDLATDEQVAQVQVSPDGTYQATLPQGRQYLVQVQAPGFTSLSAQEVSPEAHYLLPLEGGVVRLHSLRFPFNQASLPTAAQEELGKLVQFLKRHPFLQIEVGGHADHIGTLEANLRISRQRADQVANYLKVQGIATERLQVKGYGAEKPVENNLTPEQRAQNRRVDFILSEK